MENALRNYGGENTGTGNVFPKIKIEEAEIKDSVVASLTEEDPLAVCIKSLTEDGDYFSHGEVLNHQPTNAGEEPQSDIHDEPLSSEEMLMNHEISREFTCGLCDEQFTREAIFRRHLRDHTRKPTVSSKLNQQPKVSNRKKTDDATHERTLFRCEKCGKQLSTKSTLARHLHSHSDQLPFGCPQCSKRYTDVGSLNRHLLLHTGGRPFVCEKCSKRFTTKGSLSRHSSSHSEQLPFQCAECNNRYSDFGTLKRHLQLHTGVKPFACIDCGDRFYINDHLKRHQMIHSGEKPFVCMECNRRFSQKAHLKRHYRVHSGEKPFVCPVCAQSFSRKDKRDAHVERHMRGPVKT